MIIYLNFFFTLLFLFPTNILIVRYCDWLRSPHARHKESFLCIARLRTEWGEQKCGTPQSPLPESLAKLCERGGGVATTRNSGHPRDRSRSSCDHRIAREVVRTMGSSDHPKFAYVNNYLKFIHLGVCK